MTKRVLLSYVMTSFYAILIIFFIIKYAALAAL